MEAPGQRRPRLRAHVGCRHHLGEDDDFTYNTFTVVPHRGRVMLGKPIALVSVALPATVVALVVGAGGNFVGSWISGNETVWDQDLAAASYLLLSLALALAMGLACGTLIRNSAGAIVAFFVFSFVMPRSWGSSP